MMIRKELGYCPKDELEFTFVSTMLSLNYEKEGKFNTENRLQNLINKSK